MFVNGFGKIAKFQYIFSGIPVALRRCPHDVFIVLLRLQRFALQRIRMDFAAKLSLHYTKPHHTTQCFAKTHETQTSHKSRAVALAIRLQSFKSVAYVVYANAFALQWEPLRILQRFVQRTQ